MNRKGHSESLVPAHPGNTNAVKTGVFSKRVLAERVSEVEAELAARPVEETSAEALRRELAAILVLADAMDLSLEQEGLQGRGGEPRNLVQLRLRLNDKLRHTVAQYRESVAPHSEVEHNSSEAPLEEPEQFIETLSRFHFREGDREISPQEFDPEVFLRAVVLTSDPKVSLEVQFRARRLLTKRAQARSDFCVCSGTLVARDEIELREWIDELRGTTEPWESDASTASLVRRLTSGERPDLWFRYKRTWQAIEDTIKEGVRRVQGGAGADVMGESDVVDRRFWKILLSPGDQVSIIARLKAFEALSAAGAFPECTCSRDTGFLDEEKFDAFRAYVVRSVGQRHYRAAIMIAGASEVYCAIRDAIDARVASAIAQAETGSEQASRLLPNTNRAAG